MKTARTSDPTHPFLRLPRDVVVGSPEQPGILGRLSEAEVARLGAVDRTLYTLSRSDDVWRPRIAQQASSSSSPPSPPQQPAGGYALWLQRQADAQNRELDAASKARDEVLRSVSDFHSFGSDICADKILFARFRTLDRFDADIHAHRARALRLVGSLDAVREAQNPPPKP